MSLWIAAVLAVYMLATAWKARRQFSLLGQLEKSDADSAATVDVRIVIPARNEAANIGVCLDTLAQSGAAEILVVDDDSKDDTAAIATAKGARVIHAPRLPAGFTGKSNACYAGAEGARTKWLLFADADVRFEPGFAAALVGYAEEVKLDAISVLADPRCRNPWEAILAPYWLRVLFTGVDVEAAHSIKLQQLLNFGHINLFRTEAYEFTGGHRTALRNAADDIGLARVIKRHRLRYEILRGEALAWVRPGPGFGTLWRMLQRTIFEFLAWNTAAVRWQVIAAIVLPVLWGPLLWFLEVEEEYEAQIAMACLPLVASLVWRTQVLPALLAPLSIYALALAALHSLLTHLFGASTRWKGRKL